MIDSPKTRRVCLCLRNEALFEVFVFSSVSLTCSWVRNRELSSISLCCNTIKLKPTQMCLTFCEGGKKRNTCKIKTSLIWSFLLAQQFSWQRRLLFCENCFKSVVSWDEYKQRLLHSYGVLESEWPVADFSGHIPLCDESWEL